LETKNVFFWIFCQFQQGLDVKYIQGLEGLKWITIGIRGNIDVDLEFIFHTRNLEDMLTYQPD